MNTNILFCIPILYDLNVILIKVLLHYACRWRPETHSFHLPCGEMTIMLEDTHKILGLSVRGRPVKLSSTTGPMVGGTEWRPSWGDHFLWRQRVTGLRGSYYLAQADIW